MKMTNIDTPPFKIGDENSESKGFDGNRIFPHNSMDYVTDETRAEVIELQRSGVDIDIVDVNLDGHYRLDDAKQELVDHAIDVYSSSPGFVGKLTEASPAVAAWNGMAQSMSPLALGIFYNTGNMTRPSDGYSRHAVLDEPLPIESGKTATELVRALKSEQDAQAILEKVDRFFEAGSLMDTIDEFGLTPHDILAGSLDRIGDITRANVMIDMVTDHVLSGRVPHDGRGIVSASLASGAAEPVYWLINELRGRGRPVEKVHLVDLDPIALAASNDRSGHYGLKDKLVMHHKNLFREPVDSYIDPHSVDVVDIIGLFEYLAPKAADRILQRAASIVRPGGMIVFGNMLKSRPQQKWFDELWPKLEQRSIHEVIEIIEGAGFSKDQLKVRLSKDGLYPIYGIAIPYEGTVAQVGEVSRQLGRVSSVSL
jgi:SAM-dependent methyltransferase